MHMHFLASFALLALVSLLPISLYADVALPPGLVKPYDNSVKTDVTCRLSGKTLHIILSTPGPCDYHITLTKEDGANVIEPLTGSLEGFGKRRHTVRFDLPELKADERLSYRYNAEGRLYRYKKVLTPNGEGESTLSKFGRNLMVQAGVAGPDTFGYELKDKNGDPFSFSIPFVVTGTGKGEVNVLWHGKPVR